MYIVVAQLDKIRQERAERKALEQAKREEEKKEGDKNSEGQGEDTDRNKNAADGKADTVMVWCKHRLRGGEGQGEDTGLGEGRVRGRIQTAIRMLLMARLTLSWYGVNIG